MGVMGVGIVCGYSVVWMNSGKAEWNALAYDRKSMLDDTVMGISVLRWLLLRHCQGAVLEVGAGTGRNVGYYRGQRVEMIDNSPDMLRVLKQKLDQNDKTWWQWMYPSTYSVKVMDACRMTYKDNAFDTLVSTFTLCSMDDPILVLKEMKRVLKDNGILLMIEHGVSCKDTPMKNTLKYQWLNQHLDKTAENHYIQYKCHWNRNVGDLINQVFPKATYTRWHLGTTLYTVIENKK